MSYGLQVFDSFGGLSFDSNSYSIRMVYRVAFTPNSRSNQTFTIPGFDPAKGVIWLETPWNGSGTTISQRFTVSGNVVTIPPAAFAGGISLTNYINAIMFS